MIIPSPQKNKLIDIKTYELLKNSVLYYKINNEDSLAKKIMFLLDSPDDIIKYKRKIEQSKKYFIKTWKQRVNEEVKILENLIKE